MAKNKYILIIFFIGLFLFLNSGLAFASEVRYPDLTAIGLPNINNDPSLSKYVAYFFGFFVYIAGALALISFTVGAVGLIASGDKPESAGNAKDRMKGSILGLVLTFVAFLILRTINPTLVTPAIVPLPSVAGVFYTNGRENKPAPTENPDTATIPSGFDTIKYCCNADCNGGSGPALLLWLFPEKNFSTYDGVTTQRITCNNQAVVSGESFKIAFETSGVYYCLDGCNGNMCSGYMSNAVTSSESNISNPFNENIKGVRIVNDPDKSIYYGVIFHKEISLDNAGLCSRPFINTGESICHTVDFAGPSVDIFTWNNSNPPTSSGNGVIFYSEPYGYNAGSRNRGEGICIINNQDIKNSFAESSYNLLFNSSSSYYSCYYANDTMSEYRYAYKTFRDKPGSIDIKGSYLVALYGQINKNGGSWCQTFTKSVPNLKTQPFVATGNTIENVYIIPTK